MAAREQAADRRVLLAAGLVEEVPGLQREIVGDETLRAPSLQTGRSMKRMAREKSIGFAK